MIQTTSSCGNVARINYHPVACLSNILHIPATKKITSPYSWGSHQNEMGIIEIKKFLPIMDNNVRDIWSY